MTILLEPPKPLSLTALEYAREQLLRFSRREAFILCVEPSNRYLALELMHPYRNRVEQVPLPYGVWYITDYNDVLIMSCVERPEAKDEETRNRNRRTPLRNP